MRHLIDYFGRAYVINLPSRVDRKREVEVELSRVGVGFEPGRVELFPAVRPPDAGDFPSLGARGCFMSHLEILRACAARGDDRVLIMEDDLAISPELATADERIVELLESEPWGLVYIGHFAQGLATDAGLLVRSDASTIASHFYAVRNPLMGELLQYLEACLTRPNGDPIGGPMHYDGALDMFRAQHRGQTLFAVPSFGGQRSSRSDIAPPKWFDAIPGLRTVSEPLRQLNAFFRRRA